VPTFMDDLTDALVETGATIAFDAIGGGRLAGQILTCMEIAAKKTAKVYSRYGSSVHKQVYVYGSLDPRPIELNRAFGMAWGVGGWLLTPFLQKIGRADGERLRQRVVAELKTTFASHYTRVVSLQEALQLANIAVYAKRATGEGHLRRTARDRAGAKYRLIPRRFRIGQTKLSFRRRPVSALARRIAMQFSTSCTCIFSESG
jgi:hypothetical protein